MSLRRRGALQPGADRANPRVPWPVPRALGALSPQRGIGPDDLAIASLLGRLDGVEEVLLATNPNVEGEATALYLARLLKHRGVRVTRLAFGMPVGGDIEFTDEVTLGRSIAGRRELHPRARDLPPAIRVVPLGPRSAPSPPSWRRPRRRGVNTLYRGEPPIVWSEALGANVLDVDDNRYLDFTSGFGVAFVGHRHPAVVAAVAAQAARLVHGLGDVAAHPSASSWHTA
ncbi:MAG: aminotransferase class III-fold pyridoxal phosphate-dependent enzyme [Solirubrobacterales bacterium]